ncbi:MetQ/NlpA family ABC transporter substrate-binding protein [Yinghuangia sp. ASG 101]|uniref:MetQ/NlpA family ABC transporter substrate-binding protein n=1 Tax=Yinghuangia sp. ASG 101 TaxID=2896848 RepID=UPI001E60A7BA|nr:MetQ/NlpA family ABC transporter substrate-binding protein [Yinghuangia sp. ASG 101]UGQ10729.1 MetQ/NlpA family ABC transporter substrate-binding protein [Yinghuangia sp. ASG 101]
MRKIIALAAVGTLALGLAACSDDSGDSDSLKVAASAVPHAQILEYIKDNLAAAEGLKLDIKVFDDYALQNPALDDGSVDANYFQHKPYLDQYNTENKKDLVPVTPVHLEPLGVYSKKNKALTDLKDGATISFPNDATNAGRALRLLADNGLITLKDGVGVNATERDVVGNPKKLTFKALDAEQLPRTLDDVDAAVINGNYALQANLSAKDALALEKAEGNPYANLLVVKKGHENDEDVLKLKKLLNSPEVKKYIEDEFQGSVLPAF